MTHFSLKESDNYIKGYHGTLKQYKEAIVSGGFKPSKGQKHWLGEGIYFFRDDKRQAEVWASLEQRKHRHKSIYREKPELFQKCVICWLGTIDDEHFLNLDSRSGAEEFLEHVQDVTKALRKTGKIFEYDEWQLNHLYYKTLNSKYKVIQRTFPVPSGHDANEEIPFNSLMFLKVRVGGKKEEIIKTNLVNGCQIVVRDSSIIVTANLTSYAC